MKRYLPAHAIGGAALCLAFVALNSSAAPDESTSQAADTLFEQKIRPVLEGTCFKCHGGEKVRGGLRVDSRAALLKGGDSGPALVAGDAERSLLIQAIRYTHEDIKMPPGKPLPAPVVADFERWVKSGGPWPKQAPKLAAKKASQRWAFEPIPKVQPPPDPTGWSASPIDQFIRTKLQKHGLSPVPPADQHTLIRRATFDLIGLPPTPAEIDAFLADDSPDAFVRVVDRLLASPHYGERWARHWLDVVRYADTAGFEADETYRGAWKYRDYVITSLGADKPFDRFLQEQVAGDELWPDDPEARIATGMYCVGPALAESAMVSNQLEYEWLTDAADTTGAAILGLTLGCARCHDHKYDPITQRDYFALQAIFAASDRPFPEKIRLVRIKTLNGLLSETPVPNALLNDPRCTVYTEAKNGLHLFHRAEPLTVHRLHRGELSKPREVAEPGLPAVLVASGKTQFSDLPASKRRAAFTHWLTSANNPLTARVLVNRVWGWHFGQAILRTPNDFGAQGEPPTHPELLDWLARDLMEHGWSLKRLHRQIMLSRTYQMASVAEGKGLQEDPQNRLLWHFPRHRLEGEAIRDAMLACAGTFNPKPFGPPVVPALSGQELAGLFDSKGKWPVTKNVAEHTRASIYMLVRRTFVYPMFAAFDPPEVMVSCPQRPRTVVPAQALTLLNSPLVHEQAEAFAIRLQAEAGDPARVAARAWRLAFGRDIRPAELQRALAFLQKQSLAELCLVLFNANEFIYVD
jgi:Protein of unknown function (DUF1553)/Protein of unknown function (DUF1549)/Planctomycete cytochrome C